MNTNPTLSGNMYFMSQSSKPGDFGRVTQDGTVFVRTVDGEREVGQVPDVSPADALAFFVKRFAALETEVNLLDQRVQSATLSPDEARKALKVAKSKVVGANAVGDLQTLEARLSDIELKIDDLAVQRKQARAKRNEETKSAKEEMITRAEKIAKSNDWRQGMSKFRNLVDEWKKLPRIDRNTDDALWERFSAARSEYSKRRKVFQAKDNARRENARQLKQEIINEARQIAESTDWGPISGQFRDLMARWKAAGPARRDVDDQLWSEFRGLQDKFFDARSAAFAQQDAEYGDNLAAKQKLLEEAEATILPVSDPQAGRNNYRDFLAKFNEIGRVPREAARDIEARVKKLENAVKSAEEAEWRRTDPEARQRAQDTVDMFSSQIEKLTRQAEAAESKDTKKAEKLRETIATYNQWLTQAQKALDEFTA